VSPEARSILDAFPDAALLVAANGAILAANRAFRRALGNSAEQLAGDSLFALIETPAERAALYLRRCAGSRQPLPGTLTFRKEGGTALECRCDGAALAGTGTPPPTILLRCRPKPEAVSRFRLLNRKIADLTREILGRRRAEQDLRRLNEVLEERIEERTREVKEASARMHETERGFRLLVEGVTDYAIFMIDPSGLVTSWNPGAERIEGYCAEEVIGRHFSLFYTEEDRQRGVPRQALETAARAGRVEMEGWRVRKDGHRFWASVVMDAIRDDEGQFVGFAKITRDLTERQLAEERLRQAQKMEVVGQLTGGVAHDFNNLMTVVSGNLETLQRRLAGRDRELDRLAAAAMRGVERATVLTHRLLAFSRRQPLEPKAVEMNRLIIGMSDLLGRTLGEQVTIETVLSGGLWEISADPNQLENAVLNLAINARDAMPNGGKLTIETANIILDEAYAAAHDEVTAGQYVMLAVSDTGTGMTKEIMERAFEPFFTTKKLGEGTGLGLSQIYGFIKQSGGHVKLYSEPGDGTTVRLYLPRIMTPEAAAESSGPGPAIEASTEGETILVVEDDPDVRAYSTVVLRELGYVVLEAGEGDTALGLLATEPRIELLFTDVGLPGAFNGRQLAEEARKRRPGLKVLFTTGYARNAIVHHGRLDPGVDLIAKPFTYAALAAKIRLVLERRD
jgi:PAS domain S-box-containing protein